MFNAKMMQNISKVVTQTTKAMASENKMQSAILGEVAKSLQKGSGNGNGLSKATKDVLASLTKISKMVEMQNTLLDGVKIDALVGDDKDEGAEQARELAEAVKRITDENKKQASELDSLKAEVEKAAKDAGDDKDTAKRVKAASAAIEKAVKLIDEQSKLLDEAKKALAG